MARYRAKAIVTAEQFLPAEGKVPECVHAGTIPFSGAPGHYVHIGEKNRQFILSGEYIVTDDLGERSVIPQGEFESTYEIIDEPTPQKD